MFRSIRNQLVLVTVALLAGSAPAGAAPPGPGDFTNWTSADHVGNEVRGALRTTTIVLTGNDVQAGTTLDESFTGFAAEYFTPRLAQSDAVTLGSQQGSSFEITFNEPATDPTLHLASFATKLEFPAGTTLTKLSGQDSFQVAGQTVTGAVAPGTVNGDANGTVQIIGTFTKLTFTATPVAEAPNGDGFYLQVGVPAPPPPEPPPPPAPTPTPPAPPDTLITAGPPDNGGVREPAIFEFISSDPAARFECSLQSAGAEDPPSWQPCASPYRQAPQGFDLLDFAVRAIDAAGNVDPTPATRRYWYDPPAYGNFRIRGIDVLQVVQPNALATKYGYDPGNPWSASPFSVGCGGGTPTAYSTFGEGPLGCRAPQDGNTQRVTYAGVRLDYFKETTAIVYVDMEGLPNEDSTQPLDVTLTATNPDTGRQVGPVLRRTIVDPRPSSTGWVTATERNTAAAFRRSVQFTFDASWLNRRNNLNLTAQVQFVPGTRDWNGAECFAEDCSPDNTFELQRVRIDRGAQPAQLLIQPLALSTQVNETFPEPERIFRVARHLLPGGQRMRLRWYSGVQDVSAEAAINPGDRRCGRATTVRGCRWNAIGAVVDQWVADNPPRFENVNGDIVQAYDMVMGVHNFQASNSTAADLAPGGTPQPTFTEPGWWWDGTVRDIREGPFASVPKFTVNSSIRPTTALTHELGHALTAPHMNIADTTCGGGSSGENWFEDRRGRLQSTKFDHRPAGDDDPVVDGTGATLYDLMSYCADGADRGLADTPGTAGNAWISAFNWNRFYEELRMLGEWVGGATRPSAVPAATASAAAASSTVTVAQAAPGKAFAVGVAGPDGGHIVSVTPPDGSDAVPAPDPSSPFRLRALGADGRVLEEAGVRINVSSEAAPGDPGTFVGPVPRAATAVELVRDGTVLHRVERTRAPKVELLAPQGGDRASLRVRWRASDPDGDRLQAGVDFSADDGRTWRTVFHGPDRDSVTIPAAYLSGSRSARIRVTVSDGFNETSARSGRLSVAGTPPTVEVLRPRAGESLRDSGRTQLIASAVDDRGQVLDGRRVVWFAGRKRLGTGSELQTRLPAGRYTLRAVARDGSGRSAGAGRRVKVAAEQLRLTTVGAPATVARGARTVAVRVAASRPAVLSAAGRRYRVTARARRIVLRLPAKPAVGVVRIALTLRAAGQRVRGKVEVFRGDPDPNP